MVGSICIVSALLTEVEGEAEVGSDGGRVCKCDRGG
jgi:hypothetical protein